MSVDGAMRRLWRLAAVLVCALLLPVLAMAEGGKERRLYVFGAAAGQGVDEDLPLWLHRLAQAGGHGLLADGRSGTLREHAFGLPARAEWVQAEAPSAFGAARRAFRMVGFDTVVIAPDAQDVAAAAGGAYGGDNPNRHSPLSVTGLLLRWIEAQAAGARVLIWQGDEPQGWQEEYLAGLRQARPGLEIAPIPAGPVLARLFAETDLAGEALEIGAEDKGFLSALVAYAVIYGEVPPAGYQPPDSLDPLLRENYGQIAGFIWAAANGLPVPEGDPVVIPPLGLENPALAMGLNGISDWSPQHPFIDLMKTARPWTGHLPGQWGGMDPDALHAGGYLDAQGWPRAIPAGVESLETLFLTDQPAGARGLAGRYVVTWEGEGRVEIGGRVSNVSRAPGELRFSYTPGEGLVGITISRTDPAGTGDYIRNIRVLREEHLVLDRLGLKFNPDWLRLVQDLRVLRFMDWMDTNNSPLVTVEDRPREEDFTYAWRGVPVEVMVELANHVGADPWFTLPHMAEDAYFRHYADYVRDHLDPRLKAYVEYSNEVWNWQFTQSHWAMEQAKLRWGMEGGDGWVQIAGMRAAQMARIWTEAFGEEAGARLVRVISPQTGWLGLEEGLLGAPAWVAEDAQNRPPFEDFDAYAITGYFGVDGDPDVSSRRILDWLDIGEDFATEALARELRDTSVKTLLSSFIPYHAEVAARHGLQLIMYEGGTHVVGNGDWTGNDRLTGFYTRFNYTPEVAAIYADLLEVWHAAGGTLFNAFVDVGWPSRWGSWGHLRHLDDMNPRWLTLMRYNATHEVDWESREPGTFSHGAIRRAPPAGGRLEAEHPRDILLGGPGDDVLVAMGCCARIHGGAGVDVAILPGAPEEYEFLWVGDVLLAKGERGEIRLADVQRLEFADAPGVVMEPVPPAE